MAAWRWVGEKLLATGQCHILLFGPPLFPLSALELRTKKVGAAAANCKPTELAKYNRCETYRDTNTMAALMSRNERQDTKSSGDFCLSNNKSSRLKVSRVGKLWLAQAEVACNSNRPKAGATTLPAHKVRLSSCASALPAIGLHAT